MAKLEVLKFPDPRLREIADPIKKFDASLIKLSEDMLETMYEEKGIGLAAPQVGELVRFLVIDTRPQRKEEKEEKFNLEKIENEEPLMSELELKIPQPLVVINPHIVKTKGKTTYDEGCLSVPSFFETVERYKWIKLEYQNLKGEKQVLEVDGLLAIVIQHEMDHLEGTLFIDHLSLIKSSRIKSQIKKNGYPSKKDQEDRDQEEGNKKNKRDKKDKREKL